LDKAEHHGNSFMIILEDHKSHICRLRQFEAGRISCQLQYRVCYSDIATQAESFSRGNNELLPYVVQRLFARGTLSIMDYVLPGRDIQDFALKKSSL
jgi:hypothetical protein